MGTLHFEWCGIFSNQELNTLHAQAFAHPLCDIDWARQVKAHSLGWVIAQDDDELIGFVNVVWDGNAHAFILDTVVKMNRARQGIGAQLVAIAVAQSRAAGCVWLHVDFDDTLRPFYLDACGFKPTAAGLIALSES